MGSSSRTTAAHAWQFARRRSFAVAALLLLLVPMAWVTLAEPASAAVPTPLPTVTVTVGSLSGNSGLLANYNGSVDIPQFDPSWGTLKSVSLTLDAKTSCVGWAQNGSQGQLYPGVSSIFKIQCGSQVMVFSPVDHSTVLSQTSPLVRQQKITFNDTTELYSGTDYHGPVPLPANHPADVKGLGGMSNESTTSSQVLSDAATLQAFTGTGTVAAPLSCIGNTSTSTQGSARSLYNIYCYAKATVAYTYVPKAIANPDTYTVPADQPSPLDSTTGSHGTTGTVCANDDANAHGNAGVTLDPSSVTFTQPGHGTLTYDPSNCTFTYTPENGYDGGPDTFTYKICDDASDPTTCSDSTTVKIYVVVPDLTVTKKGSPATFAAGTQATYAITVKNSGKSPTVGPWKISDPIPSGLTFVSSDPTGCSASNGTVTCTSNQVLQPGDTASWTLTVGVDRSAGTGTPPKVTNTVTVSGGGEHDTTNDTATATNPVVSGSVLKIAKTVSKVNGTATSTTDPTVHAGDSVTYTVTVTNDGPSPTFDGAKVVDQLPAPDGLELVSADGGNDFTCIPDTSDDQVTCDTAHEIAVGATSTFTVTATVDQAAIGTETNTATVTSPDDTTSPHTATADVHVPSVDLVATKAADESTLPLGGSGTYTLTLGNNGPSDAGPVSVTETAGTGLTITSVDLGSSGFACTAPCSGSSVTLTRASLANGASEQVTVHVDVAANAPSSVDNTVKIAQTGSSPLPDTDPTNNTDKVTTPTGRDAPLRVDKTSDATFTVGETGHYQITVTNTGQSPTAGSVAIDDSLPPGITAQLPLTPPTGASCGTSTTTVIHCTTSGALAAGASITVDVNVSVGKKAYDQSGHEVTNTAKASGGTNGTPTHDVTTPVDAAAIGDFVWNDANADGAQSSGETGVANVEVQLLDGGGSLLASTTTDSSGHYLFDGLAAGTYKINVVGPANSVFTTQDAPGVAASKNSDVAPAGATAAIALAGGQRDLDVDAGLIMTSGGITGNVYVDHNDNGTFDSGETPIGGVKLSLSGTDALGNTVSQQTTTANDGSYSFRNLAPGSYTVSESQPSGYLDGTDSSPNGGTVGNDVVSDIAVSGPIVTDVDFGELRPASLGDYVWNDTNADGIQGSSESGIGGVKVQLTGTDDLGNSVSQHTTTSSIGAYEFSNLRPGSYTVTFTKPNGFSFTQTGAGTAATDSNAEPTTGAAAPVTLAEGDSNQTIDAGLVKADASLSATVFADTNNNGVQDAGEVGIPNTSVTLTGTDFLGNPVNVPGTTDGTGEVSFTGLLPGTYTVTETQPSGWLDGKDHTPTGVGALSNDTVAGVTLAPGQVQGGLTFGELKPASLGDFVWSDLNANGIQEAGEPGVKGVDVALSGTDDLGAPVTASTTTDAQGHYSFTNLRPGSYTVSFTAPAGTAFTAPGRGSDPTADSDASLASGATAPVVLSAGQSDVDLDAGLVSNQGQINGNVYEDHNNNGSLDAGEAGIPNAEVTLTGTDAQNNPVSKVTNTAADGSYGFTGLLPGSYTVTETQPSGYLDGKDSSPTGTVTNDKVAAIALGGGDVVNDVDFGELKPASLGDFVWQDLNANGVQEAGEPGVKGVDVALSGTDDLGAPVTASTTTDAQGHYSFTNLRPGSYTVTFTAPNGQSFTVTGTRTGTPTTDSNADPATGAAPAVTLVEGQADDSVDAGLISNQGSIAGNVYEDHNNNGSLESGETGIAGTTVTLSGTDVLGSPVSATTTTGSDGTYSFTGLLPGSYTVTETQPSGYLDGTDSSPVGTVGNDTVASIAINGNAVTDVDFGELKPASLGDFVWQDLNANGIQEAGEPGVKGVDVALSGTDDHGPVSASTTTDAQGHYSFTNLRPGSYTVTFTAPNGQVFTLTGAGTPATDSDAAVTTGAAAPVTLAEGDSNQTIDAGLVSADASVSATVFEDHDNDGTLDAGEPGIPNTSVTLTGTDFLGNPVNVPGTTDGTGEVTFAGLLPGTYTVAETQPSGYLDGKDASPVGTVTNDTVADVVLAAGQVQNGLTFGELKPASLGDVVWSDLDADGVQDSGEPGVEGVSVALSGTDDLGAPVTASTTTDAQGHYSFTNLRPGSYTVTFTAPADEAFTVTGAGTAATDSNADPTTGAAPTVTLVEGQDDATIDSGLVSNQGSVSGSVYVDHDNDGVLDTGETPIEGTTVTLTGTDLYGNPVSVTGTTAADGTYSFPGLLPGTYTVTETQPDGYLDGQTTSPNGGTVQDDVVSTIDVNGAAVDDVNFGELRPATIGDTVWNDTNDNGVHDAGEPGEPNVTVTLTGTDDHGPVTETTTTDAHGHYSFTELRPGSYTVTVTQPDGTFFTVPGKDSSADVTTGATPEATLTEGGSAVRNAGVVEPVSIDGTSFYDTNDNGVRDPGEKPKPNVKVTITGIDDLGTPYTKVVTTDADGHFSLAGLRPGTYSANGGGISVVHKLLPAGHLHIDIPFPPAGIEGTSQANTPGVSPVSQPSGPLAFTGANSLRNVLGALGALLLGALLVLLANRRRRVVLSGPTGPGAALAVGGDRRRRSPFGARTRPGLRTWWSSHGPLSGAHRFRGRRARGPGH